MDRPVTPQLAGFTLAELIVAATLTALIGGATVGIVRSTAGSRALADREWALQQEARVAADAIATALRNVWYDGGQRYRLIGADAWQDGRPADALRLFVTTRRTIRPRLPESDVMECEFRLAGPGDPAPGTLLQRIDPTLNEEPDGGGVVYRLAQNVVALEIQYYDGTAWRDDWPEELTVLPLAVRVSVTVAAPAEAKTSQAPALWSAVRLVAMPSGRQPAQAAQAPAQEQSS
jgi:type II secretion system protein J